MTIEYIAGFFDGESCININKNKVRISVTQTHEEVLLEIMNFFGFGSVSKLKKRKDHWKDAWVYYVSSNISVFEVLKLLEPHLIVKKQKAQEAIKVLENYFEKEKNRVEKIEQALFLVKSGKSYREAEKETSVNRQTICNYINK